MLKTPALLLLFLLACVTFSVWANDGITFKDKALSNCITLALEKSNLTHPAQLKKLKCHNKNVQSLAGIEQLENLEHLSLFGNKIVQADLTQLKKLGYLNLAKNDLTSLNIKGLTALKTLYLFNNQLTTVNFAGVSSLEKMRVMQNQLTVLDISPLTSLKEAYLWDNQLEDLQITGLTQLEFLDVKQNPMPDALYDFYDEQVGITISHDGNADDWK